MEGQTRQAYSAYHQVARNFPDTPQGRKADELIRQAQKQASWKVARLKKK